MINRIIKSLVRRYIKRNPLPDFVIGDRYLERWYILPRNRFCNLYLHVIHHDDDDRALHDHPWHSLSYVVSGTLIEITKDCDHVRREGQIVYRSATLAHRLEVVRGPVITLFLTGPRVRSWGFHCPKGWVHWLDFVSPDDKGQAGRGCE